MWRKFVDSLLTEASFSIAPIIVNVGASPSQRFYVTESIIRNSSKFFDAALKKEWKEGQERTINLPEIRPEVFNVYLNWLVTGKLHVHDQSEVTPEHRQTKTRLVEAYLLGDKILDVDYKEKVCDALAEDSLILRNAQLWVMGTRARRRLYEDTPAGAPVRRLLIVLLLMYQDVSPVVKADEPNALLHDIMSALVAGKPGSEKELREDIEACKFHEHEDGAENCYRNKRRRIV